MAGEASTLKILAESYYSKLWIGDGTPPVKFTDPVAVMEDPEHPGEYIPLVVAPKLGWGYVDATTGDFYIYDGTQWNDSGAQWSGAFL